MDIMKSRIWLSLAHMGGREQEFIQEAFDTNWVVPLGPNVNAFEEFLQEFLTGDKKKDKRVVALSAGTAALHLGLILLGVGEGDEVICQSFTFSASANPIAYQGATPVFVDSEGDTWNMDPELLEMAIKDRLEKTGRLPKAIIPVHLYGIRGVWMRSWRWRIVMGFRCWRIRQRRWVRNTRDGSVELSENLRHSLLTGTR